MRAHEGSSCARLTACCTTGLQPLRCNIPTNRARFARAVLILLYASLFRLIRIIPFDKISRLGSLIVDATFQNLAVVLEWAFTNFYIIPSLSTNAFSFHDSTPRAPVKHLGSATSITIYRNKHERNHTLSRGLGSWSWILTPGLWLRRRRHQCHFRVGVGKGFRLKRGTSNIYVSRNYMWIWI